MKQEQRQWQIPRDGYERADYQCPTTGEMYHPLSFRVVEAGGEAFVWAYCSKCDDHGRARNTRDYDGLRPQPHLYTLVNEEQR